MSEDPNESVASAADWEIVRTLSNEEEAELIVGLLQANGVPAEMESLYFHQEPAHVGNLGESRVRVPAGRREEAERLLAENDQLGPLPEEVPQEASPGSPLEFDEGDDPI